MSSREFKKTSDPSQIKCSSKSRSSPSGSGNAESGDSTDPVENLVPSPRVRRSCSSEERPLSALLSPISEARKRCHSADPEREPNVKRMSREGGISRPFPRHPESSVDEVFRRSYNAEAEKTEMPQYDVIIRSDLLPVVGNTCPHCGESSTAHAVCATSSDDVTPRATNTNHGHMFMPKPHNSLEKWQSQHMAKAIVDNAINKTLEEVGISRDFSTRPTDQLDRVALDHVLRTQGLQGANRGSDPINNVLEHLTQVSENIFTRNMFVPVTYPTSGSSGATSRETAETQTEDSSFAPTTSNVHNASLPIDTLEYVETCHNLSVDEEPPETPAAGNDVMDLSVNDVLNHAVNAAISEKGLCLQSPSTLT